MSWCSDYTSNILASLWRDHQWHSTCNYVSDVSNSTIIIVIIAKGGSNAPSGGTTVPIGAKWLNSVRDSMTGFKWALRPCDNNNNVTRPPQEGFTPLTHKLQPYLPKLPCDNGMKSIPRLRFLTEPKRDAVLFLNDALSEYEAIREILQMKR